MTIKYLGRTLQPRKRNGQWRKDYKLPLLALILIVVGSGFILYHANADEYVYEAPVVLTAEEKLTQHLSEKMVEQTEMRAIRVRAELALIEAKELEAQADSKVVETLEAIMLYQGI